MYYPPNQPNPYNNPDPTTSHWQSIPYDQTQPTYPGPPYPPRPPMPPQKPKWYKSNLGVIAMLILFFPIGLVLMWSRDIRWPKSLKWSITGFFALYIVITGIVNTVATNAKDNAANATATAQTLFSHVVTPRPSVLPTATPLPSPALPTPTPTPIPQQVVQPTQPPPPTCAGTLVDGVCYSTDPTGGALVYSPATDFCHYFTCVSTFWTATSGYVVECGDGHYSHSGGVTGACSRNGGVLAAVYSH